MLQDLLAEDTVPGSGLRRCAAVCVPNQLSDVVRQIIARLPFGATAQALHQAAGDG